MPAQQQAERLLERAINHYDGALELIGKSVDNWFGQLELQGQLSSLLTTALNSKDLHVRAAALEIELAGYNLPKRPESANNLTFVRPVSIPDDCAATSELRTASVARPDADRSSAWIIAVTMPKRQSRSTIC